MDDAVAEVFERMLERRCEVTLEQPAIHADISARISLSGTLQAQCIIEFPSASAQRLTDAFLGSTEGECDDSMVADAVGELCNMIAGGWKKRLGAPAWGTDLSVPCISRGSNPSVPDLAATRMRRAYVFDDAPFAIILIMFQATGPFNRSTSNDQAT